MQDLTPRQTEILKTVISHYTDSGEAVGSEILDKKFNLGVSPATIRNEMVELAKKGYLKKEHFSSGRIPTAKAFRFYIQNLMEEKELSTADEVSYKSDIWDFRANLHPLLQHATKALAHRTKLLAVTATNLGDIYYFGINNVLLNREFWDIDQVRHIFDQFDESSYCSRVLSELGQIEDEILCMFEDSQNQAENDYVSVFGEFKGQKVTGAIGVIGPKRIRYDVIIPNVRYFNQLLNTIINEQGL